MAAPLTTEEARDYAQFRACGGTLRRDVEERLFAWVRAWREARGYPSTDTQAHKALASDLGLTRAQAKALGKAAGWSS